MKAMKFPELFQKATKNPHPFPYQIRFAESEILLELVHAPTGAGKTATAILGWLWRYFQSGKPTPRRLVYCLPMRVLVEQTRNEAAKWLKSLGLDQQVGLHVLMGGEETEEWDLDPAKPAILIGTQDMLLSRALNRGYGMGRFRWPMHYGLLNNDALWVLDEIQLMGTGLATTTQLQAFRESLGTYGTVKTIWMSATLRPEWLKSVDFRDKVDVLATLKLDPKTDYKADGLRERWEAKKQLASANATADDTNAVAKFVVEKHLPGSLTLVIVNTVDRCRKLFEEVRKLYQPKPRGRGRNAAAAVSPMPDLKLIHSRFRPKEREEWSSWLTSKEVPEFGRIVVSTQVVEAGVDLSARTLITELAPWPSLVQRVGRCNRRGEFTKSEPAHVFWIDVPTGDEKKAAPYRPEELDAARERLNGLDDVGLKSLTQFFDDLNEPEKERLFPYDPLHVVRRKDFIDLFDTTPDLAGNDIDVSRFIRDGEELDVQVFWRKDVPPKGELKASDARRLAPVREELCTVKVADFRAFLDEHTAHRWDALSSTWIPADEGSVYPGQVYWLAIAEGGYDRLLGWSPSSKWAEGLWLHDPASEPLPATTEEPGYDTELLSMFGWQTIADHTRDVLKELDSILEELRSEAVPSGVLSVAIRWHDWGKAHPVFQDAIRDEGDGMVKRPEKWIGKRDIAKAAPEEFWKRYERRHFRHELASALGVLALIKRGDTPKDWQSLDPLHTNLALYLVASHHGKMRLSIRSMPEECVPAEPGRLFARGVWQDDTLPSVDLGGMTTPEVTLDLSPMRLGRVGNHPSWAECMLKLRDHADFGPLRLAYLEALIRAADMRASRAADERAKGGAS